MFFGLKLAPLRSLRNDLITLYSPDGATQQTQLDLLFLPTIELHDPNTEHFNSDATTDTDNEATNPPS